jgi:hypothetical protein
VTAGVAVEQPLDRPPWRRRRQLRQQSATKRSVGPALYRVMEPGEQILAGAFGRVGRLHPWAAWATFVTWTVGALVTAPFLDLIPRPLPVTELLGMSVVIVMTPTLTAEVGLHRGVFLAVTDRQLICVRMRQGAPVRPRKIGPRTAVRFHVPLESVRLRTWPGGERSTSVTYLGPGVRKSGLRVTTTGIWREDLDEVVSALRARAVPVDVLSG